MLLDPSFIVATTLAIVAWAAYRKRVVRNYGMSQASKLVLQRFPATYRGMSRTIAVTGGCGFLGRRIVQMLLERYEDVRIVVVDMMVPKERHPRVEYIRASITDSEQLLEALQGAHCVIHTARLVRSGSFHYEFDDAPILTFQHHTQSLSATIQVP